MVEYLSRHEIPAARFARDVPVLRQTFHKYLHNLAFPPAWVMKRISEMTAGAVTANDWVDQQEPSDLRPFPGEAA